jgi:hypothetical protein
MPLSGIRNAHAPIMTGNAAVGFRPNKLSSINEGAYRPMPKAINAPSTK